MWNTYEAVHGQLQPITGMMGEDFPGGSNETIATLLGFPTPCTAFGYYKTGMYFDIYSVDDVNDESLTYRYFAIADFANDSFYVFCRFLAEVYALCAVYAPAFELDYRSMEPNEEYQQQQAYNKKIPRKS